MKPYPQYRPLFLAQYVPEAMWDALPPDELESWLKARVPQEMAPNLTRGMQAARFQLQKQKRMVAAVDAYLAARPANK